MRKVVDKKQPDEIQASDVTEEMHLGVILGDGKILYSIGTNGKSVGISPEEQHLNMCIQNSNTHSIRSLIELYNACPRFVFDDFTEALRWLVEDSDA